MRARLTAVVDDFKTFALRGNVVDLAVAVVLGVAFNAVVQSLANDVLLNLVAAIFGEADFSTLSFTLNGAVIGYGSLVSATVNFVLVAVAVYAVVRLFNRLQRPEPEVAHPPTDRPCPYCVTTVPAAATRCPACTSELEPLAPDGSP